MMRLKAADGDIAHGTRFEACYGGTEANVLACMHGLGHSVKYVTALPDSSLGEAVLCHLHGYGVDTSDTVVRGDTLGIYFVEDGAASRGSNVVYQRRFSEFTRLTESDIDYDRVFDGADLFHVSGISFALSDSSRQLAFRLLAEARARRVPVSFDFNYRAKLWSRDEARVQYVKAASYADILLASSLDLQVFLQTDAERIWELYPNCKYLAVRDRKPLDNSTHSVSVSAYRRTERGVEQFHFAETPFAVTEKIGGGDAFDGCMLHALLDKRDLRSATLFAVAGFILKHSQKGDTFDANADEIARFASTLNGYES